MTVRGIIRRLSLLYPHPAPPPIIPNMLSPDTGITEGLVC